MSALRGFFDLRPAHTAQAEGEICRHAATKEHRFLRDHADLPPQRLQIQLGDVVAVD